MDPNPTPQDASEPLKRRQRQMNIQSMAVRSEQAYAQHVEV
jgi:hypothetical protein